MSKCTCFVLHFVTFKLTFLKISSHSREPNFACLLISWLKCIVTPLPRAHLQLPVSLKKQGVQSLLVSFHIFTVSTTVHRSPAVMCAFCFVFSIQTGHHGRSQTCSEIREAVLSDKRGTLWRRAGEGSSRGLISHINGADWIVEIMALPVIRCPGEQHRENGPQTEERWDKGWLCPQACIKALVSSLIPQCPLPHIGLRAHKSHGPTTTWTKTTFIPIQPCSCSSSGTNKTAPFLPSKFSWWCLRLTSFKCIVMWGRFSSFSQRTFHLQSTSSMHCGFERRKCVLCRVADSIACGNGFGDLEFDCCRACWQACFHVFICSDVCFEAFWQPLPSDLPMD